MLQPFRLDGRSGIGASHRASVRRCRRVNVIGAFLVTREATPLIRAANGFIINITSVAGLPWTSAILMKKKRF